MSNAGCKKIVVAAGIRKKKPLAKTVIIKNPATTVMKGGRTSSLLREALLLPQRPLPKAYVLPNFPDSATATLDKNNEPSVTRKSASSKSVSILKEEIFPIFSQVSNKRGDQIVV